MSRIRSSGTKPELVLRRMLFARGLRFRVRLKLIGKPDIVFTRAKLAIFVDGCFWHGCPEHGTSPKSNSTYWAAKLERNKKRDAEVSTILKAEGWTVMRFWDHDVRHNLDRVADEIKEAWRTATAYRQSTTNPP